MAPFIDVYNPELPATEGQTLLNNLLEQSQFSDGRDEYLNMIRQIESDNNPMAEAKTSTASGVYQFTEGSVKTAKNRAINLGADEAFIELISNDPRQWTDREADILMLTNMLAQSKKKKGYVDDLLVDAFGSKVPEFLGEGRVGDRDAKLDAYYQLHHTDPDDATINRAESIIK